MSGPVSTSRVFQAARVAKARLSAVTWPAHPRLASLPAPGVTYDSSVDHERNAEIIAVSSTVGEDDAITPHSFPDRREETLTLSIKVLTATGEHDDEDVIDRLEALCNEIQTAAWDTDAASPTGRSVPLGDNGVKTGGVASVQFSVFTDDDYDGYLGTAEVVYQLQYRI